MSITDSKAQERLHSLILNALVFLGAYACLLDRRKDSWSADLADDVRKLCKAIRAELSFEITEMARNLYCPTCAAKAKSLAEKFNEEYRAVEGRSRAEYICDYCSNVLAADSEVVAFTQHRIGPDAVAPWEEDYIHVLPRS